MTPDPEAPIAELEAENATLREQVELLAARVEELQAQLATLETVFTGQPLYPAFA